MNEESLARILRTVLQIVGTYLATSYGITEGNWIAISGAIVTLATTAYTMWTSWNTKKVPA